MSTLKVDSIGNSGSAVNFPNNVQAGDGFAKREYTSSATAPSGANNGALWWDTANEGLYLKIAGFWYEVSASLPPIWYGSRGLFGGGNDGAFQNVIDYVTIATAGNATDFGDNSETLYDNAACSNGSRIVFGGGQSAKN